MENFNQNRNVIFKMFKQHFAESHHFLAYRKIDIFLHITRQITYYIDFILGRCIYNDPEQDKSISIHALLNPCSDLSSPILI